MVSYFYLHRRYLAKYHESFVKDNMHENDGEIIPGIISFRLINILVKEADELKFIYYSPYKNELEKEKHLPNVEVYCYSKSKQAAILTRKEISTYQRRCP